MSGFERHQRRGEGHEHCDADIMRLEKRLKDFEIMLQKLNDKSEHIQGQNLMIMSELNKYKEKEQVLFMALHMLVNLAGFSTSPQVNGNNNA